MCLLRQESKCLAEENEQLRLDIEESARELYDQMKEAKRCNSNSLS